MNYVFINCAVFDKGGYAMIKGAYNGIKKLDPESKFDIIVHKRNYENCEICDPKLYPSEIENSFKWADVALYIGGIGHSGSMTKTFLDYTKQFKLPFVWMSVSFLEGKITKEDLLGTYVIARGERSSKIVENITGITPLISPDMSFLIEPKKWEGPQYINAFTTHLRKPIEPMYDKCKNGLSIQIIWKLPKDEVIYEPELPIKNIYVSVEENFGLIESVEEVHTARYQAACATILAGKDPQLYVEMSDKYKDLLDLKGTPKNELINQTMKACNYAVNIAKEKRKNG